MHNRVILKNAFINDDVNIDDIQKHRHLSIQDAAFTLNTSIYHIKKILNENNIQRWCRYDNTNRNIGQNITLSDIENCMHLSLRNAALKLNMSIHYFKKLIKNYGINKWPRHKSKKIALNDLEKFYHLPPARAAQELNITVRNLQNNMCAWPTDNVYNSSAPVFCEQHPVPIYTISSDCAQEKINFPFESNSCAENNSVLNTVSDIHDDIINDTSDLFYIMSEKFFHTSTPNYINLLDHNTFMTDIPTNDAHDQSIEHTNPTIDDISITNDTVNIDKIYRDKCKSKTQLITDKKIKNINKNTARTNSHITKKKINIVSKQCVFT